MLDEPFKKPASQKLERKGGGYGERLTSIPAAEVRASRKASLRWALCDVYPLLKIW